MMETTVLVLWLVALAENFHAIHWIVDWYVKQGVGDDDSAI